MVILLNNVSVCWVAGVFLDGKVRSQRDAYLWGWLCVVEKSPVGNREEKWCNVMILVNCLSVWRVGGVWDVDDVGEVNGVWKIGYALMEDGFCGNRQ
jgi:hypothetical protein